jgi:hypothetical protein
MGEGLIMATPYETNINGARLARKNALECQIEAATASPARAAGLIEEHARHIERAEFYEFHASFFAPKIHMEIAA